MSTTLGTAYVQIVPSARGIGGSISQAIGGEAASAGSSAGSTIASKIKGAITVAAIGQALKTSILEGAALEQSLGGIETLFKGHADSVIKNADRAYKTAGISANSYMEQATSFAASLLQAVSGNTREAARLTDMAIIDMSDNANKMGTDMQRIQDAYQGFAKQNYTMLDNLKLGYGGTKTEMERLLVDAEKLTGIKYDINNLADVYSAIHVIQEELGITGTTAKEAASTLAGSFNAMRSAFQNFMGDLTLGRNIGPAMVALAETATTFLFNNLIPAIGNIIMSLPTAIYALVTQGLPQFLASGAEMVKGICSGILSGIPTVCESLVTVISSGVETITANLPNVLQQGVNFVSNFVMGIIQNIPTVLTTAGTIISTVVDGIVTNWPVILEQGRSLIHNIATGIIENLPEILDAMMQVTGKILKALVDLAPLMLRSGIDLIATLASGIGGAVLSKVRTAMDNVKSTILKPIETARDNIRKAVDKIKSFFNITLQFKGIKLPHISVSWKTGGAIAKIASKLGLPGVPDFNVSWYKTGGIFDSPSVIGVGEAGAEAVVPLDRLWSELDQFVDTSLKNVKTMDSDGLTEGQVKTIVGETIMRLAPVIAESMAEAIDGTSMILDRRELGRMVRGVL